AAQFPYRLLLRWSFPDHIDRAIKRLLWLWVRQEECQSSEQITDLDYFGAYVCWLIAVCPDSPAAVLDALSEQQSAAFLERIAENPNTWPTTLQKLGKHPSYQVRIAVADNNHTPIETIVALSADENADVRYAVAASAHRSQILLAQLAADENGHVAARSR